MSKLRLVAIAFLLLSPHTLPGHGASERPANSKAQSSHLLRASVIGAAGYGYPGASTLYKITGTIGQSSPVGDGVAHGKALYAGFWGAAWTPAQVTLDIAIDCPPDSFIPAYSTVPDLALSGFKITNQSSLSLSIGYDVTTAGIKLNLVDNGNPASLSGTTPPLAPGASFSPPEAALEIPQVRYYVIQDVDYRISPVGSPNLKDSCTTTITVEPPVAVLIASFEALALDDAVELTWEITADEQIEGFRLYRGDGGTNLLVNADHMIPREIRSYLDGDVKPGKTYRYTLAAVREDGSEVRSQVAVVKTKNYPLGLRQNYPNPFNPMTTISFTLPVRINVNLSIFNVEGELIKTLVDHVLNGGLAEVNWDGSNTQGDQVSSGVYVYRLKAGTKVLTKKMVLLK